MRPVIKPGAVFGLPSQFEGRARDFFCYSVTSLPLAAAGNQNPTFSVQNDSDFVALGLSGIARDPAAPATRFLDPAITIQILDQGAGRNLFSQPLDWASIVGDAEDIPYWPEAKIINRASTVTVQLASLEAAGGQDYNVRLAVVGFKVFVQGG